MFVRSEHLGNYVIMLHPISFCEICPLRCVYLDVKYILPVRGLGQSGITIGTGSKVRRLSQNWSLKRKQRSTTTGAHRSGSWEHRGGKCSGRWDLATRLSFAMAARSLKTTCRVDTCQCWGCVEVGVRLYNDRASYRAKLSSVILPRYFGSLASFIMLLSWWGLPLPSSAK